MINDELFDLFTKHLVQTKNMAEKADELIKKVSGVYCVGLMSKGWVPLNLIDTVIEDVQAELLEIYRKKTYGFITLEEYRETLILKKARK